jgi:hypothetical protein
MYERICCHVRVGHANTLPVHISRLSHGSVFINASIAGPVCLLQGIVRVLDCHSHILVHVSCPLGRFKHSAGWQQPTSISPAPSGMSLF